MRVKPIVNWLGGKSRLANKILENFPQHICYVEPFCGGAAIFLRKTPSKCEVINDINGELINLYRCIQNHPDELSKYSATMLHSRELFNNLKNQPINLLTDIQKASRFYAINKMSFAGKCETFGYSRTSKANLSFANFKRDVQLVTKRIDGVHIENINWRNCIERYDSLETLFYCDPPYFGLSGYGMEFGLEQYEKMAELGLNIKGKMIISVNDIEEMRQIFKNFQIERLSIKYSVSKIRKLSYELLIKNF